MVSGSSTGVRPDFRRASRRAVSSAALEQTLGLPPGAWRRRRLFLLTLRSDSFTALGLHFGDQLVVEPGSHATEGRLMVVRHTGGRLGLARLQASRSRRALAKVLVSADPADLPYPLSAASAVGAVIAILGSDSKKKCVGRPPGRPRAEAFVATERTREENRHRLAMALDLCRSPAADHPSWRRALLHRQDQVETLGRCLDAVEAPELYDALVRETNRVLRQLRRLVAGGQRSTPQLKSLGHAAAKPRPQQTQRLLARRSARQRTGSKRTESLSQGVDRTMPEVV